MRWANMGSATSAYDLCSSLTQNVVTHFDIDEARCHILDLWSFCIHYPLCSNLILLVSLLCVQIGVFVIVSYILSAFVFNTIPRKLYHGVIVAAVLVNAVIARFTDTTTIYVVPTPSKPKDKAAVRAGVGDKSEEVKSD